MAGHSARAASGWGVNAAASSFTSLFALGSTWDGAAHIQSGSPHLRQCSGDNSSQTPLIYACLVVLNPAVDNEANHRVLVFILFFPSILVGYRFFWIFL